MSSVVGTKGQITLEKGIRDALGIQPGWRAIQRQEGETVVLEFLPPKHRRSLAGMLAPYSSVRIPADENGEAYRQAVDEARTLDLNERYQGRKLLE